MFKSQMLFSLLTILFLSLTSCTTVLNGSYVVVTGKLDPVSSDIPDSLCISMVINYIPQTSTGTLQKAALYVPCTPIEVAGDGVSFKVQLPIRDYRNNVKVLDISSAKLTLTQDDGYVSTSSEITIADVKTKDIQSFTPKYIKYPQFQFAGVINVGEVTVY